MENVLPRNTTAVVGGGLGGLACAVYLAKAGRPVQLFEMSSVLGGKARSQSIHGYIFNIGAHASYNSGAGTGVLRELGIDRHGGSPPLSVVAHRNEELHPISAGLWSILSNRLLSMKGKLKALRILGSLNKMNTESLQSVSWAEWLEREVGVSDLSAFMETLFRLVTIWNDPNIASVAPALDYLKKAYDGVLYLDGGWQSAVDSLADKAVELGVRLNTGTAVEAIEQTGNELSLIIDDGNSVGVSDVVLAIDPKSAARIVRDRQLAEWAATARPVRSAALQIGLSRLPCPDLVYCLGVDRPLYFSVHSAWAKLAPKGGATVELQKYLGAGLPSKPEDDRRELESFMDTIQPGWRRYLEAARFLPEIVSSTTLVEASKGGLRGRYPSSSTSIENLYFVGDWVGSEGILSDASLASARLVSKLILNKPPKNHQSEIEVVG